MNILNWFQITIMILTSSGIYYIFQAEKQGIFHTEFQHEGTIDSICSDVQTLKRTNRKILHLANKLSNSTYFRIFKVNLETECPFWAQKLICKEKNKCAICPCDKNEVPQAWLQQEITDHVSTEQIDFLFQKNKFLRDDQDQEPIKGIYIDLKKNPEAYTGYQGQKIWKIIYTENCFQGQLHQMCNEERVLNKIISGLHSSVSTQLTEFYIDFDKNRTHPNRQMFFDKVGNHPERILNLYFAYSVLLRAINRGAEFFRSYDYKTGDFQTDLQTKVLMNQLLNYTLSESTIPFIETALFNDLTKIFIIKFVKDTKKQKFMSYVHNITKIMDCVECEKCKVYGKMQIQGIRAALKILFNSQSHKPISLHRNEIIALINTFVKFSTSLDFIDKMFERRKWRLINVILTLGFGIGFLCLFLLVAYKINHELKSKFKGKFAALKFIQKQE